MSFVLVIQLRVTMLNNRNYSESRYTQKNLPGPYSMTEEVLQERAKKVNAGRFITQAYAGVVASVSSVSFGTVLGWSSPAIRIAIDKVYRGQETLNPAFDLSWVASLGPLGCALGVPVWSYFNIKLGPRKTMLIQSPLLLLTWALIANAEEHVEGKDINLELAMRFFCGFFAISNRICGESLLQDAVHRHYLMRMVIPYRSSVNLGVLITYCLAYSISEQYFAIVNCVIVVIHFILLVISPESPVYLYDKNLKKAEASLAWYRGKSNIYVEMRNIKKDSDIRKLDQAARLWHGTGANPIFTWRCGISRKTRTSENSIKLLTSTCFTPKLW
ncbi:Major Facilitator Superfamily [Popillia japonica]|uniref:Major Facilitator Superfamily n=1 Tax=Popillia japonica TaxID=7064 RepID=A0AAW1ISI6_POPJA